MRQCVSQLRNTAARPMMELNGDIQLNISMHYPWTYTLEDIPCTAMFPAILAVPSNVCSHKFSKHLVRLTESLTRIVLATFGVWSKWPSGLTTYSSPGPLLAMLSSFMTSGNIIIVQSLIGYQKTYHCGLIVTSPSLSSLRLPIHLPLQCCFAHSPYQHVFSSMCANDLGIAAFESHELN